MAVTPGRLARQVATWLPAALLVPAAMVAGVQVSEPKVDGEALRELVPLEPGTTWVYAVFDHGEPSGTRTRQIVGQALVDVDGIDTVAVRSSYTDYPGSGAISELLYLKLTDEELQQIGVYGNHEHLAIDPAAPAYRHPAEPGDSWSFDGTVSTAALRYETTLEAIEDVEVSGREFTDCRHFVTTLRWKFAGQEEFGPERRQEEWTCPGVGPVRLTDVNEAEGTEVTEEIVEFHGATGNWYAEAPDAVEASGATGTTSGLDAARTSAVEGDLGPEVAWTEDRSARFDFPPASEGDAMVLAERDGEVSLTETDTGHVRWRVRLEGPPVAAPTIAGDRVLVADAAKRLWALSLADGSTRWVRSFDDVVSTTPVADGPTAVVATDDRRLVAIDVGSGHTRWETDLPARLDSPPAVADEQVLVADSGGEVAAYAMHDGRQRWSRGLDGGTLAGPTVADGKVLVGDDTGVFYALDPDDGEPVWEATSYYYASEAFAAGDDVLVVVADSTRVEAYDLDDGDKRWSQPADDIGVAPVVVGDRAVTVDEDRVQVRDLGTGEVVEQWSLPRATDGERVESTADPAVVDGALVLHVVHEAHGRNDTLVAYGLGEPSGRPGVAFTSETRDAPGFWVAPSVLDGERLFVPGQDGTLYRSDGPGAEAVPLLESETLLPGAVLAGEDVVLTHADGALVAVPTDGGEPLWRYESAASLPGSLPAVSEGTVFVPLPQEGLAAVSLADGEERWKQPIDLAFGSTTPLVLPDGDVVYGGGALGRYDGETGQQRWSVLDGVLFSAPAYADGLVFADVVPQLSRGAFTALDARTGEVVWRHPTDDHSFGPGPVVADGVVLFPDSRGRVTAYEAATGQELWQVSMATPVAGTPVVVDGVAYVAETGRVDDLRQRENRVSAHDLRTGRYLGSFQPPAAALGPTTKLGGVSGPGGALLVPTNIDRPVVMIVRPR